MKAHIESIKLGLQTLVYLALLVLILSLFFKPEFTAKRTGNFFKAFQDHNINIKIAALGFNISSNEVEELTEQSAQFDAVKLAANCLVTRNCDEEQQKELVSLLDLKDVAVYLAATDDPAQPGVLPEPVIASPTSTQRQAEIFDEWVVIMGADQTIEAALDEKRKIAGRAEFNEIELIHRDGVFRTVAFFDSREAANAALPALEAVARRKGIYSRATAIWCKGKMARGVDTIISCG